MQSFLVAVTVTLLLWSVHTWYLADAFHPSQWRRNGGAPSRNSRGGGASPHWYADDPSNAAASTASAATTTTNLSSFQQRMLKQLKQHDSTTRRTPPRKGENKRSHGSHPSSPPALIEEVHTLADFQDIVTQAQSSVDAASSKNNHNMILVWWYAPWCTACHALRPGMVSLARRHAAQGLKVVSVACDETNAGLHQGFGAVPSVPYVHVYRRRHRRGVNSQRNNDENDNDHGTLELVEETKLNKKKLNVLHKTLQDYEDGSCSLERLGQWSVSCPYSFAYYDAAVVGTTTTNKLAP